MSDGMERLATGEYARVVESKEGSGMSDIPAQLSEPMTLMRTKDVKHLADRIEELEAKLEKAEDFVRRTIRYAGNSGDDFLADKARTTLAEVTGGNDD